MIIRTLFQQKLLFRFFLLLKLVLLMVAVYRVLALDIIPNAPNDTVYYLDTATTNAYLKDPTLLFRPRGTKTGGYSLYLTAWYNLAPLFPLDGLTLMTLSQRVLLATGVGILVWQLGIVTAPIVFFLTSGHIVATTNILYTEGLTVPLAILYSAAIVTLYRRRWQPELHKQVGFWLVFFVFSVCLIFLALSKLSLLPMALPTLSLIVAFSIRRPFLRWTKMALPVMIPLVLLGVYLVGVTIDNYLTYDSFTPVAGSARGFYWGAYQHTFVVRPENRNNPALAEFYDGGSPYPFIHGTERDCGGLMAYKCTEPLIETRANAMLDAAGIDRLEEVGRSFVMGVGGGELQELEYRRNVNLQINGTEPETGLLIGNWYSDAHGFDAFLERFNRGEQVEGIDGLNPGPVNAERYRTMQRLLTVLGLVVFSVLFLMRRIPLDHPAVYGLAGYLVIIAAVALNYLDLWRYIAPAWAGAFVLVTYAVKEAFVHALVKTRFIAKLPGFYEKDKSYLGR